MGNILRLVPKADVGSALSVDSQVKILAHAHQSHVRAGGGTPDCRALVLRRYDCPFTNSARPASFTPCTANTFLARSIPTVRIARDFPLIR